MELRADRCPSVLSYLLGVDGSLARLLRGGGVGSLSLRVPEINGVHFVLVAKSVFGVSGTSLFGCHPVLVAYSRCWSNALH